MRDDTWYDFSGRTNRSVANGRSSAFGGMTRSPPVRSTSKVDWSAPVSHGSLTDTVRAPGNARCTAWWRVSTSGDSVCMAHGQVAGELVTTCSPAARSYQALWRMP